MALVSDSTTFSLGISNMLGKAQRMVSNFMPQTHSPEHDLLSGPLRDARLAPRVPMDSSELDVGMLAQLSSIGLKRGKQVSFESHPELMRAWKVMAQRAGLSAPPQLIIAQSDTLNALTVNKDEVVITTGLLKILDLRETVAVLGHELGHVQSDHTTSRLLWSGGLGGLAGAAGNEFGRRGGLNMALTKLGTKFPIFEKLQNALYGVAHKGAPSSVLGSLVYIGAGISAGAMLGRHFSVRPTELDADTKGAAISGDPTGLAAALNALQQHAPRRGIKRVLAHVQSGYPSTEKRVIHLQALAGQAAYRPALNEIDTLAAQPQAAQQANAAPAAAVQGVASAGRIAENSTLGLS